MFTSAFAVGVFIVKNDFYVPSLGRKISFHEFDKNTDIFELYLSGYLIFKEPYEPKRLREPKKKIKRRAKRARGSFKGKERQA